MLTYQSVRALLLDAFARPPTPATCREALEELKAAAEAVPLPEPDPPSPRVPNTLHAPSAYTGPDARPEMLERSGWVMPGAWARHSVEREETRRHEELRR